ncbi:MAG TPA: haloacid dehalogenase-like hydrolase [Solirubrobacteraceae bacterium]|nr:haloacid dehalogenase-like hydrolase [Solirubrobacteraceae bacterium]
MLLLFDIDGTLVCGAAAAHAEALHVAIREVHHVDAVSSGLVDPAGRTDGEIARILLLDAGVSAERIDALADEVREQCCRVYGTLCPPDLSHTVVPGIPELLIWLAGEPDVTLGLLTGNYEGVARVKLGRAGIGSAFVTAPGAFGSDAEDRAALPHIARRRAGASGTPYPRSRTVVIGDTPRDIACAHADEVRCVAVTTGPHGAEELSGADAVATDTQDLRRALASMLEA